MNSAPITADAATTKTIGVKKSFTVSASSKSKVTKLSKAEKNIVSVSKKGSKFTVTGKKAGKASFKIGSKSYTVKVGATSIKKISNITLNAGKSKTITATANNGAGDTLTWKSSNTKVAKVSKTSTKANTKKKASNKITAQKITGKKTATITVASKYTGKKVTFKVTVKGAAATATATPSTIPATDVPTNTPETGATSTPTATGSATATPTATATATGSATTTPTVPGDATATPAVTGSATPSTAPSEAPSATPTATAAPTQTPVAVSASVVSVSAVNTQGEEVALNAITKNATIEVTFSEAIKSDTVNNSTFKLTDANGKNISIPASDVVLTPSGKKATVNLLNVGLDKKGTYTLTVSGVKTYKGEDVVAKTISFTVNATSVVKSIRLDGKSADDKLDTNMNTNTTDYPGVDNEPFDHNLGKKIIITYDELVDATTVTAANVVLTNISTGERVACDIYSGDGKITLTTKSTLVSKNLYKLTINGVKTAVNGETEAMSHVFTVNGVEPLSGPVTYRTLDGSTIYLDSANAGTNYVWPKLTAGLKDKTSPSVDLTDSKYYAGLQINATVQEDLDAASVKENVLLVEKETKAIVPTTISWNAEAKMITIVPKEDLKEKTDYQIQFLGGLMTTDYVYLNASKKADVIQVANADTTFTTLDATAPEVESIVCESGTNGLEAKKAHTFVVTFSEPMTTLTNFNVVVAASSLDLSVGSSANDTDFIAANKIDVVPVAGTNNKQFKVTIKEGNEGQGELKADKAYKLYIVGKDVKDYDAFGINNANTGSKRVAADQGGNFLKKSSVYAFSTENDTTAPKLLGVYDKNPYDGGKDITSTLKTNVHGASKEFWFVYDEEIQEDSDFVKLQKEVGGKWEDVSHGVASVSVQRRTTVDKDKMLKVVLTNINEDVKYRIALERGAVRDTANDDANKCNIVDLFRYEFIGSEGDDEAANVHMYTALAEDGSNASSSTDNVDVKSRFFVVLDENETTGITAENLTVKDANGNLVSGTIKQVTNSSWSGTVYSFTPAANLAYNTTYTVILKDVKDIVGNTIVQKAIDFKTAKDAVKVASVSVENNAVSVDRQKTITFTLDDEKQLVKGTDVTLVKDSDGSSAPYTLSTSDKKTYSITFGTTNATRLAENTPYTLTITPSTGNEKEIKFITGKSATDDVKPSNLGKIATSAGSYNINGGKATIVKNSDAKIFYVPYSEGIDVSKASVKVTLLTPGANDATDIGVLPLDAVCAENGYAAAGTNQVNNTLKVTLGKALADSNDYKIEITGVKDSAGNEADDLTVYASVADSVTLKTVAALNTTGYKYYTTAACSTEVGAMSFGKDETVTVYAKNTASGEIITIELKANSGATAVTATVKASTVANRNIGNSTATLTESTGAITLNMVNNLTLTSLTTTTEGFVFYTDDSYTNAAKVSETNKLVLNGNAKTIYAKNVSGGAFTFDLKSTNGTSVTVENKSYVKRSAEEKNATTPLKTDTASTLSVADTGVVTLDITDTPTAAAANNSCTTTATGSYGNGSKITITFNEAIKVSNLVGAAGAITNITDTTDSNIFGTGATIAANNAVGGYATSFTITLGESTNVAASDMISVATAGIEDMNGNVPSNPITFSVPDPS